jgi:hypothetical protein
MIEFLKEIKDKITEFMYENKIIKKVETPINDTKLYYKKELNYYDSLLKEHFNDPNRYNKSLPNFLINEYLWYYFKINCDKKGPEVSNCNSDAFSKFRNKFIDTIQTNKIYDEESYENFSNTVDIVFSREHLKTSPSYY